ncbi:hypothetical protein [Sphingobium yanoikuyae]|uniref:hypothetical protein n=1 Tax=Sphingobium yanoikuyae TaxID=13690 RepID=UPI0026EBB9BB|nr:hypothetical protein [Sphingobium yanoikuyae]
MTQENTALLEALDRCDQENRTVAVPIDLYRQVIAALSSPTQSSVEAVSAIDLAKAINPSLFSDDAHIRHQAASPYDVAGRQSMEINKARGILDRLTPTTDSLTADAAAAREIGAVRILEVFRRHYELNDCEGRTGNIEIPVSALRAAAAYLALPLPAQTVPVDVAALEWGFNIGQAVEKFTGEAIWHGTVVARYLTGKGKPRYVVEVHPQGFQMIAVPSQLRAHAQPKGGEG